MQQQGLANLAFQIAAADAWDIRGLGKESNWDEYAATFIAGEPALEPRVVAAPIRQPPPRVMPRKSGIAVMSRISPCSALAVVAGNRSVHPAATVTGPAARWSSASCRVVGR